MYNYLQVWVIAPLLELILSNYENRLKSFHVNFNPIWNILKQSNCTLDFGKYSWDWCRPSDCWGMWRIECCSDIFPIPLNPTKSGQKINCGLETNKVDDWNVWYSKHPSTELSLAWLLACHLSTYSHHWVSCFSCKSTNNIQDDWTLSLPLVLYGNIMESITVLDSWQAMGHRSGQQLERS